MSAAVIVSASIAGGHDAAARELARRLSARGLRAEVFDLVSLLPAGVGRLGRRLYRAQLTVAPRTWEWVHDAYDRPRPSRLMDRIVDASRAAIGAVVGPDTRVVVSTYPLAGQAIGRMRSAGELDVPALAYLTDMSVHRLWRADGVDAHLAIHPDPARQARSLGAAGVEVVAPAIRPVFGTVPPASRAATRVRFGLPPHERLALVVGGSWGVGRLGATMVDVAATGQAVPVAACGTNRRLRARLRAMGFPHVIGWTDELPELMAACDVVVQNSGGLTSMEAIASGLPVISYRCLPGHGRTNSLSLDRAGLAPLVRTPAQLRAVLSAVRRRTTLPASLCGPDPADVIEKFAESVVRPETS